MAVSRWLVLDLFATAAFASLPAGKHIGGAESTAEDLCRYSCQGAELGSLASLGENCYKVTSLCFSACDIFSAEQNDNNKDRTIHEKRR